MALLCPVLSPQSLLLCR